MHELSLAKNLAAAVFNAIKNESKGKKLKKIVIVIGEASGIEKDFLNHSLKEHVFKGTDFEDVEIEYKIQKVSIKCKLCNKESTEAIVHCVCGSKDFDVISGKDVYVEEIELEQR